MWCTFNVLGQLRVHAHGMPPLCTVLLDSLSGSEDHSRLTWGPAIEQGNGCHIKGQEQPASSY